MTNQLLLFLEQIEFATEKEQVPIAKRAVWRHKWVTPVMVEFVNSKGSSELLYVVTRTISAEGLDFRSPRMLERGLKVLIFLETEEAQLQIPATVMHSTESVGMPIIGVKFHLEQGELSYDRGIKHHPMPTRLGPLR